MIDEVGALLRETAATDVLPAFRRLDASEIEMKAPGEVVTVADRRAESRITDGLTRLLPGSVVVGEEAVAADATVLRRLTGTDPAWLVDPIDGTANFVAGREPFAVMVALLHSGVADASWILDPVADTLLMARAGAGAYLDGARLPGMTDTPPPGQLRGVATTRFLPTSLRARAERNGERLGELLPGQHCAGREYQDIAVGKQHFAVFWRTLPWDHVPGALLVREMGGVVRRFDGSEYDPTDDRIGLLAAANEEVWTTVHDALLQGL